MTKENAKELQMALAKDALALLIIYVMQGNFRIGGILQF